MSTWTLANIREKTRRVTGRLTPGELSNTELDEYINKYYTLTFPAELKLERKLTYYEFNTVVNQQEYTYPTGYTNFVHPGTMDNFSLLWFQTPGEFVDENAGLITRLHPYSVTTTATISAFTNANPGVITVASTVGLSAADTIEVTGVSGSAGVSLNATYTIASLGANTITTGTNTSASSVYASGGTVAKKASLPTTTLSGTPISPGTVIVNDLVETFTDDGLGVLTGSITGTGTIDYDTGILTVNFTNTPITVVDVSYMSLKLGRPSAVLSYDNKFKFYPTPDTVYRFKIGAYQMVSELVNATDRPDLDQWGPCIAYGAARDILADLGEMDVYAEVTVLYKEQLAYVLNRTIQNLLNTRAAPNF